MPSHMPSCSAFRRPVIRFVFTPTQEIGLLQLAHESLLHASALVPEVVYRSEVMQGGGSDEAGSSAAPRLTRLGRYGRCDCMVVIDETDRPMPTGQHVDDDRRRGTYRQRASQTHHLSRFPSSLSNHQSSSFSISRHLRQKRHQSKKALDFGYEQREIADSGSL